MKKGNYKRAYELFAFPVCDLKLVAIDSTLNSAPGNLIHFFEKDRRGPKKAVKLEA